MYYIFLSKDRKFIGEGNNSIIKNIIRSIQTMKVMMNKASTVILAMCIGGFLSGCLDGGSVIPPLITVVISRD
jgi:hypothetical protein